MKKIIFYLIVLIVFSGEMVAQNRPSKVPAIPTPIKIEQPDGDSITIRLIGDEWRHFRTTLDGYVIVQASDGFYYYAQLNKEGNIIASKYIVRNEDKRTKREKKYLCKMAKNPKLKLH